MLSDYKIFKHPHEVLRRICTPCDLTGASRSDEIDWILGMYRFYAEESSRGGLVGLAANQLGRSIRAFIALGDLYVNPEITWMTNAPRHLTYEGCASLEKGRQYPVHRAQSIELKWLDLDGREYRQRFNGYKAQVIQHEMDHLNGILLTDYEGEALAS